MANSCDRFDEYFAYRSGDLRPEALRAYERHLAECEECQKNKETMEALLKIMVAGELEAKKQIEADIRQGRRDLPPDFRRLLDSLAEPATPRGKVISFPVSRLRSLGFTERNQQTLQLAAAEHAVTPLGSETHSYADIKISISIDAGGALVANVERSRLPIMSAKIALVRATSGGAVEICAEGESDVNGEAILGKAENFRAPEAKEHYELKITLPFG